MLLPPLFGSTAITQNLTRPLDGRSGGHANAASTSSGAKHLSPSSVVTPISSRFLIATESDSNDRAVSWDAIECQAGIHGAMCQQRSPDLPQDGSVQLSETLTGRNIVLPVRSTLFMSFE